MYRLEPMREEHLEMVLEWRNRPEVRQHMFTQHVISWEEHTKWFKSLENNQRMLYFVVYADADPVGVVSFTEINQRDKNAFWGFYSGDMSRRGIGTQMEYLALEYAFEVLELEKLCGEILVTNKKVLDFHRKTSAMRVEGLLKKQFFNGERFVDVYRVALMRDEWLKFVKARAQQVLSGNPPEVVPGFKVGDVYEEKFVISRQEVADFTKTCGDDNPIHLDDAAAQAKGFERAIAHGILVASKFSKIFGTTLPGPGSVYINQSLNFMKPVLVDQEITAHLRLATQIGRRVILETKMLNDLGEVLLEGEAELMIPKVEA